MSEATHQSITLVIAVVSAAFSTAGVLCFGPTVWSDLSSLVSVSVCLPVSFAAYLLIYRIVLGKGSPE